MTEKKTDKGVTRHAADTPREAALTRRTFIGSASAAIAAGASVGTFSIIGRAQAAASGTVTMYTSMPTSYSAPVAAAFNKLGKGITVNVFYAPTYQALQRLEAELKANRVLCDIFLIADPGPFLNLKARKELLDYVSPEAKHYGKADRDKDGLWVNGRTVATMFAYNNTKLGAKDAPKTWQEFADAKWTGKLGGIDPRVGGTGYSWYYVTRNTPSLGVKWWEKLAKTKMLLTRGHGALMDRMVSGELPVTEQLDYAVYINIKKKKAPITAVYPPEITPVTIAPIAVIKRGPNNAAAKVFYDWWLSKAGQEVVRDIGGVYSARKDVAPLAGKPAYDTLKVMDIDYESYLKDRKKLTAEFVKVFGL
ncbi:MAG: extracellular solute-binding protein [Hyphomicrobiaceae bacterium]|nr:extracellular solute-binding protein [Hyphomicrobiaceae bacterium]